MSAPYRKFRIMETQQQINILESRQLELRAQVSPSKATQKPKGVLMKLTR